MKTLLKASKSLALAKEVDPLNLARSLGKTLHQTRGTRLSGGRRQRNIDLLGNDRITKSKRLD